MNAGRNAAIYGVFAVGVSAWLWQFGNKRTVITRNLFLFCRQTCCDFHKNTTVLSVIGNFCHVLLLQIPFHCHQLMSSFLL